MKPNLRALTPDLSIAGLCTAQTTPPDLTATGAIAAIKAITDRPNYVYSYNLGPTGLRGWVHYDDRTASGVIFDTTDDGNYVNVLAEIQAPETRIFARIYASSTP